MLRIISLIVIIAGLFLNVGLCTAQIKCGVYQQKSSHCSFVYTSTEVQRLTLKPDSHFIYKNIRMKGTGPLRIERIESIETGGGIWSHIGDSIFLKNIEGKIFCRIKVINKRKIIVESENHIDVYL